MPTNFMAADSLLMLSLLASICFLSAFLCAKSTRQAHRSTKENVLPWLLQAGISSGFGTWAGYFLLTTSIHGNWEANYSAGAMLLSLIGGCLIAIGGLSCAVLEKSSFRRAFGGSVLGLSIVYIQEVGSWAIATDAEGSWPSGYRLSIISLVIAIEAFAVWLITARPQTRLLPGTFAMASGIFLHHCFALAAMVVTPGPPVSVDTAHINSTGLIILIGAGACMLIAFWFLNITQRKRILTLAIEKDRNLRILIDSVRDYAIFTVDPAGRISNWNASAQRFMGYEASEVLGKSYDMLFQDQERHASIPATILKRALADARYEEEGLLLRKDGSTFLAHAVVTPMYERSGRLLGFAIVAQDITKARHDSLRLAEITHNFDTALRYMSQGLSLFDADHRLVFANQRALDIIKGNNDSIEPGVHFREVLRRVLATRGLPEKAFEERYQQHMEYIARPEGGTLISEFPNGAIFSITNKPLPGGGWVSTIDDITTRRRDEARIHHMAYHDALTGLPNRAHFNDYINQQLERAGRCGEKVAMLAIDLDRFKDINDLRGHAVGDKVLKVISDRLRALRGEAEFLSRIGGDEFAAIQYAPNTSSLREFASRIHQALHHRIEFEGYEITPGGSIGIAIYPDDATDQELLMSNADLALYRAKSHARIRGQETVCYYESHMDEASRDRRALAKDLWQAIPNGEFSIHYQVQKAVSSQTVTGYEALLRWHHPQRGLVSPADFIPVAEESGAILDIGEWVLRTACVEAAQWPTIPRVAVNLSPMQLAHPDLPDLVQSVLRQSGLPPQRLELEITESTIISDKVRALSILRRIKALGVTIAIDDFGTGYSSLDTLNAFPFDRIKIDRSFLLQAEESSQARAIVRAILALGRSLEIPVLAEGVETISQLELLRSEGCDEAQGYFLGRPAARTDIREI